MRISDWSSDVCSSDLAVHQEVRRFFATADRDIAPAGEQAVGQAGLAHRLHLARGDDDIGVDIVEHQRQRDGGQAREGFHGHASPFARGSTMRPAIAEAATSSGDPRSEEHTSELQSLMRISYAVFCLEKKMKNQ